MAKQTKDAKNRVHRARNGFVVRVIIVGLITFGVVQALIYVFADGRSADEIALSDLANK
ncbi:MAG: hypothetical protein KI792_01395 [Alphaproteobacteria bacterium]|nr:hypothetical protein [Alphaproteobacteria bacterium SS10]